jgi:hypothetical protein
MSGMRSLQSSVIPLDVASAETWTPSRRLQSAALAERERVQRKLAELDRRHAELARGLDQVAAARDELREQLSMLNRLAHDSDDVSGGERADDADLGVGLRKLASGAGDEPAHWGAATSTTTGTTLRGQAIREAAVRVLAASPRAYDPVHYKAWFGLLRAEGLLPAGKDPLATFLTQLGRSPVITRTSGQGIYMLDHEFPDRAQRKLEQLQRELRDAHDAAVGPDVANVAAVRERRSELVTEVERLERELDEALRSLTPAERPLSATG